MLLRLTCDSWEDTQAVVLLILVGTLRKVLKRGVNRQALFAERVEDAIHIQHHERFHSSCRCHVPAGALGARRHGAPTSNARHTNLLNRSGHLC